MEEGLDKAAHHGAGVATAGISMEPGGVHEGIQPSKLWAEQGILDVYLQDQCGKPQTRNHPY